MDKFAEQDQFYLEARSKLASQIQFDSLFEIADHAGLYSGIQTIGRQLAIYEAFKSTVEVPGDIYEFGCWKGSNLMFLAKLLSLFAPHSLKQVFGFESFAGLQTFSAEDGDVQTKFQDRYRGDREILEQFIRLHQMESWVHLVEGNALDTLDAFDADNRHGMMSLGYIDFDLYAPCVKALDFCHRRLSTGGLIILDEALTEAWKGEGQALREFLDEHPSQYEMRANSISRQPTVILQRVF